ncbi:uncharacterized protein [Aegilops tauschii subsp. strangulata]|uniref:uncharacterized protein n=1 Tax=Aegilops tauschii subsp. strangulata TaxID=200361 RepID=UPI003CC8D6E3
MRWSRWSDLPPDLAREISGRLHDATDLVHFHAVCRPWRGSWSPAAAAATTTARFVPWLLAAVKQAEDSTRFEMRCVLSNSIYRSQPLQSEPWGNWVTSPNGTALRCLTIQHVRPSLHDLLTGAITHLPLLPHDLGRWEKIKPRGVIYGNGTTLLYSISYSVGPRTTARFRAALLRPGDAEWTIIKRALEGITWLGWSPQHGMCVAYHGGKILLIMKAGIWRLITPETDDVLVRSQGLPVVQLCFGESTCNFVLESRGEILWVSIQTRENNSYQPTPHACLLDVTVSVQALEEPLLSSSPGPEEKRRWVRRDGYSLGDRVLFLGLRRSFAVDAAWVPNGHGGCAYFVYHNNGDITYGNCGVLRCSLIDGKTELVQRLPRCWDDKDVHMVQP